MPSDPSEETDGGLQELNLDQPAPDLGARRQQIRQMVDARAAGEFEQAHPFNLSTDRPPVPTNRYRQAEATVLEQDRADAMAQRRAQVDARRAQLDQQKARNAQSEATFRGNGQQFYTDPYGEIKPVLEAGTNRPLYHPGDRTLGQDRQGLPAFIQRDKYGQQQYRRPPLKASEDPLEGQLYADLGDGQSVPYMSVDNALKHPDIQIRRQGMVADRARKNALRAASEEERKNALAPLEGAVTSADLQIKAARDRRDELEQAMNQLTEQIGGAAQTEAETTGLIMKTPTQRALVAKKINDQRRAQLSGLQTEADAIDESLKPRGALSGVKADAESKRAVFKAQAIIATYDDQIGMLQDRMKSGGGNPEKDAKTLATMQAARKAIADGLEAHTPQAAAVPVAPASAPPASADASPFTAAAQSAVSGIGAVAKGAELAAYKLAPAADELGRVDPEMLAEYERRTGQPAAKQMQDIQKGSAYQWGSAVQEAAKELYATSPESDKRFLTKLGHSAGGFLPLIASGPAAPITMGLQATGDEMERIYADRVAKGASPEVAADFAMRRALVSGTAQAALFEILPKPLQNAGSKIIDRLSKGVLSRFLAGRLAQGAEGAVLGGASAATSNVAADRPTLEGTGEGAEGLAVAQMLLPRGGGGQREPGVPPARAAEPTEPIVPKPTDRDLGQIGGAPEARVNIGGAEGTIFGEDAQALAKRREAIDQLSPDERAAKLAEMETEGSVIPAEPPLSRIPAPPTEIKSAEDSAIAFGASDPANRIPPQRSAQEAAQPFIEQEYREAAYRDDPLGADPERYAAELRQKIDESNEAWNARVRDLEVEARRAGQADAFEAAFAEQERQLRSPQGATDLGEHLGREGESNAELMTQRRADVEQRRQEQAQRAEGMESGLAEQERIRQSQRGGELLREDLRGGEPPPTAPDTTPVPIGPRDPTVSTGTGVPTAKEEAMLKEQRRLIEEHNKPQRLFHGGPKIEGQPKTPMFFTSERHGAEWYAGEKGGETGGVHEFDVHVKNPLDLTSDGGEQKLIQIAKDAGVKMRDGDYFLAPEIAKHSPYDGTSPQDLVYIPAVRDALKKAGYDGLKLQDMLERDYIDTTVALDPEQIKAVEEHKAPQKPNAAVTETGAPANRGDMMSHMNDLQMAREHEGSDRPILVSKDGHVVDGHHQWMAALDDPNTPMPVIQLNAPIEKVLAEMKEFPSTESASGAKAVEPTKAPAATIPLSDRAIAALQKAKIGKPGRILSADPFTVAYDAAIDFAILAIRAGRAVGDVVKLATQRFMAKHPKATPEEISRVTAAINSAVAAPAKPVTPESKPSLLPESLKAAGAPAETINYEVRAQDARKQEASDIIKRDGAAKAEEMITSSELPGDTKVAIGGQLINDKMLSLAKATPEEAAKLAKDIQRITARMQPKLATEAGQTTSMFGGILKDIRTATAMEYIRDAQGKRLEKMGGEEGGKAADEAAKIFNKTKDPAARDKEIDKLKERYTTKPVRRMLDQLKRMEVAKKLNDLGVLTRDDMVEVAGNALGIPGISQKRLKHIAELADRVHTAKNHADRSRADLELTDTLNIYKGVSPLDLEASILTLNILSGPTTQAANILGNTLQGISQIGHAALANPTKVRALVDGILDGIPDGMTQAKSILATGRGSRDFADKTGGSSNVLNTIDYAEDYPSLPKKAADALTMRARMVEKISRFMKAADAVFYYPAREAYARLVTTKLLEGQYKGDELDAKVDQLLHTTTASFESARKQAEGEGYDGVDLGRRVSDIIEERRAQTPIGAEAVKQSERFAAESTYNQEPVGLAGVIYRNLARTSQEANIGGVPILKPWTMFLKIPANVFNETTNFTPIGGVRATFGMKGEKYRKGATGEGQRRNFNRDERNRLYLKSIVGTTLMAGLVARSIQNPDDTPIVSANGPQDTAKRRQLMNAGWKPYSIRVGDKWISYRDSPLLVPLAVAGHVSDSLRYNKPEPDVTTEQRVADAVLASPQTIFQTSMLSGMADLMASLSGKGGGIQAVGRTLGSIPANLVIPYNRLLQQIDQTFDPKTYDTNAVVGGVPFVRRMGNEIADVQGRPQTYSPSDRFASAESKDPVDRLLLDKNLAIPEVGRDVKIGNRNMTEDEHDLYRKISGQRIRVRLQTIEPRLRGMTREKAQDEIERISREERARVKPRIAAQVPMATAAK